VEASYRTLSEDLVNLRVKCDTGSVRVYSKRGQLLDSTYVFAQGYKVAAGQLVWIDFGDVWNDSTLEVDSIRIRYQTNGNSFEYASLRNVVFMETRESIEQEIDTTKLPRITGRGLFRIPPMIKEALVEIHHKGKDTAWEEETGLIIRKQEEDNRIYDIYGRYWGTAIDRLPAGVYIRGGKKVVIH